MIQDSVKHLNTLKWTQMMQSYQHTSQLSKNPGSNMNQLIGYNHYTSRNWIHLKNWVQSIFDFLKFDGVRGQNLGLNPQVGLGVYKISQEPGQ